MVLPQGCVSAPACCQIRSEDVGTPCGTCTDGPTQRAADPGQQGEIPHGDSGPGAGRGLRPNTPEKLQATCPEEEAQRPRTSSSRSGHAAPTTPGQPRCLATGGGCRLHRSRRHGLHGKVRLQTRGLLAPLCERGQGEKWDHEGFVGRISGF